MKYGVIYMVYENNVPVHTSRMFSSVKEAVDYFLKEDAPQHYADDTFTCSDVGSYFSNNYIEAKKNNRPCVMAVFREFYPSIIPASRWKEINK